MAKGIAQKIVYQAFEIVQQKTGKDPLEAFNAALETHACVRGKGKTMGGSTYQVPMEVRPERRLTLGLRWLRTYSRLRSERAPWPKLAAEIIDAINNTGGAVEKKRRNP